MKMNRSVALACSSQSPRGIVGNRYVETIQALCISLQFPIPHTHALFPPRNNNAHMPAGWSLEDILSEAYSEANVYLHSEDSAVWKNHITGIAPQQRHLASTRRRLSAVMHLALKRHRCMYCWLPEISCICAMLEAKRQEFSRLHVEASVVSTMLLHSEEIFRTTNTGHLAAFVMNCEVRVWGVAQDEMWLAEVGAENTNPNREQDIVLLYPEDGCACIDKFVMGNRSERDSTASLLDGASSSCMEGGHPAAADADNSDTQRVLHLILSDGTWGQAHRLNRHVPRSIPRVALTIDPSYESLFASLRKQTRATGVSTLEATVMAVVQRLRSSERTIQQAAAVESLLVSTMKRYVDLVSIHKHQEPVFGTGDSLDTERVREESRLHHQKVMARERQRGKRATTPEKYLQDPSLRVFLPPPVLTYCYVCDMWVGWSRMPGHVLGSKHQEMLTSNPSWTPSPLASDLLSANFHIQRGNEVPLLL